jgi:hypothetical protein
MVEVHGTTERVCPEAGGLVHIRGLAVDQESAETRTVHVDASWFGLDKTWGALSEASRADDFTACGLPGVAASSHCFEFFVVAVMFRPRA